jgi:hypothetical protein
VVGFNEGSITLVNPKWCSENLNRGISRFDISDNFAVIEQIDVVAILIIARPDGGFF